jgi:hypothetical protein
MAKPDHAAPPFLLNAMIGSKTLGPWAGCFSRLHRMAISLPSSAKLEGYREIRVRMLELLA